MISFSRGVLLITTALAGAALAGCAETTFAVNAAKQVTAQDTKQQGIYKIGDPYQINGTWYYPAEDYGYNETGIASFYGGETQGVNFHGRFTANGETYDMNALTAAHRTLPMPSLVRVTNLENGRSIVLRVNDRGPYARGRIIDLSRRSAQLLGFEGKGTAMVRVQILADESRQLKAAMLQGNAPPGTEMVAAAPRGAVQSDALPPPPGARAAAPTTVAALPPPSQTLSPAPPPVPTGRQRNGRPTTITQTLGKPAAPVTASGDTVVASALPAAPAPATSPAARTVPLPHEVAALPVPEQAKARVTVSQQKVGPATMFVQAGAFSNFDNASRLSIRLARYGRTQVTQVSVNGQHLYRVRIGPVASVNEADNILDSIAHEAPQARIVVAD
jgi:rare lipoprotein A